MFPNLVSKTKPKPHLNPSKVYPELEFLLKFDGCSKGNPGLAGAGAVIYQYDREIWSGHLFIGNNYTNNHAEYMGLIFGLNKAKELGIKTLKVEGDSLLVINQMSGLYKCKSENLLNLYIVAKKLDVNFDKIIYSQVLRNENKRADELANKSVSEYLLAIDKSDHLSGVNHLIKEINETFL